jgi:hypothetical protein
MPNKPKTQAHQSYYYSLTQMVLFAMVEIVGTGGVKDTDYFVVDEDTATAGLTLFLVPRAPIGSSNVIAVVSGLNDDSDTDSASITVATLAQQDKAYMVTQAGGSPAAWTDVSDVTLQASGYGVAGDWVEVIGVPNPTVDGNWTAVHYMRSSDITPGPALQPIPSGMDPQRVTNRVRQEHGFALSGLYVDNDTGLSYLRGREICFMVENHEDGGPVVSEYIVLGNAAVQDAPPSAADNADITIAASGTYRRRLVYAL